MSEIDWSKAPEDATHAGHAGRNICWYRNSDGVWFYLYSDDFSNGKCDWKTVLGGPSHNPLIKRISEWSGEGLPPVGTVCELSSQGADWGIGTIQYTADNVIVWRWERQQAGQACACYKHEIEIRPIRTPDQIAAEEREAHVLAMLCHDALGNSRRGLAEALYDAGFRKQGDQP